MRSVFARKTIGAVVLGAALFASPLVARAHDDHRRGDDRHHNQCRALDGPFSSTLIPPPTCTSPVGICTHGILTGDLDAIYDFTMQTLEPDPTNPARQIYTGTSVITPASGAQHGQMFSDDTGFLDFSAAPPGSAGFETTAYVVSGTKHFKHASGYLVASGILNFATGEAVGSYEGSLCKADEEHNQCGGHGGGHH